MRTRKLFVIPLALLACSASPVAFSAGSAGWQYEVTPYLFGAGLDGKVGVRGVTSDVDASFNDIWNNLDQAFMGLITAKKGPWTYSLDAIYVKLSDEGAKSVTGPFGRVDIDGALKASSKVYIYQGSIAYRVLDDTTAVDLLGGLRYTKLDADASVEITTTPGIVFPGGSRSASGSDSWTDAVVGVRALHPLNTQWSLLGYGDIGGGGSDLTYQFMLGANWEFAKDFTAKVGYRQLYWDYKNDGTEWDMTMAGPYLGLGIRF
ncbi:MAG: hypothetical protein WCD50_05215 [Onishia taeanensis]|uniref:hypothetical protein n=1 Tax=Onishia taeanensis TaxID=284577 RepID=UPI003C7A02E6